MTVISEQELIDAQRDATDLGLIVNGAANVANPGHPSGSVTTRLGRVIRTLAYMISNGGILAYDTVATMNADHTQGAGTHARVWNDGANNGLYVWNGAAWVADMVYYGKIAEIVQPLVDLATDAAATAVAVADGTVPTANLPHAEFALADLAGSLVTTVSKAGYQHSFTLAGCDTIRHIGDSIDEGGYPLKDKGWIPILSNFSRRRHVNAGVSGNRLSNIIERIADNRQTVVADVSWNWVTMGLTVHSTVNAEYTVIKSFVNETAALWAQNAPKVMSLIRANGSQPVILSEYQSANASEWDQQQIMANTARRFGADFIDVRNVKDELALVTPTPFMIGDHPGTRTVTIYHAPMRKWEETLPPPQRSIKIYNLRSTFAMGALSDLVFDTTDSLVKRFKEISIGQVHLGTPNQDWSEELSQHDFAGGVLVVHNDDYNVLQTGGDLALQDYALLRIAVPGTARSLDGVGIELTTDATEIYVLDHYAFNSSGTDVPMGAWTEVEIDDDVIPLRRDLLQRCMRGNEIFVLLHKAGGQTIARPVVHYTGSRARVIERVVRKVEPVPGAAQLLAKEVTDTLAGWTVTGAPATVVPFDLGFGCPRKPDGTAIVGVTEITAGDTIGQALVLPATAKDFGVHPMRVWARYWPRVYLSKALAGFGGFPDAQVLDRSAGATFADNPIQADTLDFRTLRLTTAFNSVTVAAGVGAPNAYEFQDKLVGLYWTPVDFVISASRAAIAAAKLNFNLSCTDGTLQIGRVSLWEGNEYVLRQ